MDEKHLPMIFQYMGGIIRSLSGHAIMIGGRPDHIHILATLPVSMSMADFIRSIKASSSKWIKTKDAKYRTFSWQEGYAAFSVSASNTEKVIQYIANQKKHHQERTAHEEFYHFMKKHGINVPTTDNKEKQVTR